MTLKAQNLRTKFEYIKYSKKVKNKEQDKR